MNKLNKLESMHVGMEDSDIKMAKLSHTHKKNVKQAFQITDNDINNFSLSAAKLPTPNPVLIKDFENCGKRSYILAITTAKAKAYDLIFYDLEADTKVKQIPNGEVFVSYQKDLETGIGTVKYLKKGDTVSSGNDGSVMEKDKLPSVLIELNLSKDGRADE